MHKVHNKLHFLVLLGCALILDGCTPESHRPSFKVPAGKVVFGETGPGDSLWTLSDKSASYFKNTIATRGTYRNPKGVGLTLLRNGAFVTEDKEYFFYEGINGNALLCEGSINDKGMFWKTEWVTILGDLFHYLWPDDKEELEAVFQLAEEKYEQHDNLRLTIQLTPRGYYHIAEMIFAPENKTLFPKRYSGFIRSLEECITTILNEYPELLEKEVIVIFPPGENTGLAMHATGNEKHIQEAREQLGAMLAAAGKDVTWAETDLNLKWEIRGIMKQWEERAWEKLQNKTSGSTGENP